MSTRIGPLSSGRAISGCFVVSWILTCLPEDGAMVGILLDAAINPICRGPPKDVVMRLKNIPNLWILDCKFPQLGSKTPFGLWWLAFHIPTS